MISTVIFDLFGTLIDNLDFSGYNAMLSEMAEALGVPAEDLVCAWREAIDERMRGANGETTRHDIAAACRAIGATPPADRLDRALDIRLAFTRQTMVPTDETLATLTQLRADGYRIGLVSDCTAEVPTLWSAMPLAPLIDHPIFSCREGITKPDPRMYLLACQKLGVDPQECLYVGDGSSQELTGASAVGMRAVMIDSAPIELAGVDRTDALSWRGERIATLSEVIPLVQEG